MPTLTVKELKRLLTGFKPDALVYIRVSGWTDRRDLQSLQPDQETSPYNCILNAGPAKPA